MSYILSITSTLYAILMAFATIQVIHFSEHPFIFISNLIGSLCLLLYFMDYRFLYVGVSVLFITAILNGTIILNRLTPTHIATRLIFSFILISINYFTHHP